MPRHSGGGRAGVHTTRSGGRNTRRLHTRKNTYAEKQSQLSPYWAEGQRTGVHVAVEREPRHRYPMPLGRPVAGRKNQKPPGQKPQQSKGAKGGSKGGKTPKGGKG